MEPCPKCGHVEPEWRVCDGNKKHECTSSGTFRRRHDKSIVILYRIITGAKTKRTYLSLHKGLSRSGTAHRLVMRTWGPPNPDTTRYDCIDHVDNNPLNNNVSNLRWSNHHLNGLNTELSKGWTLNPGRTHKFKAHLNWMGCVHTLGRFHTAEEAAACYQECKAWIQVAYREHKYVDSKLVVVWRALRHIQHCEVDAEPVAAARTWAQRNHILSHLGRNSVKAKSV